MFLFCQVAALCKLKENVRLFPPDFFPYYFAPVSHMNTALSSCVVEVQTQNSTTPSKLHAAFQTLDFVFIVNKNEKEK